jgi:hypothetical protein
VNKKMSVEIEIVKDQIGETETEDSKKLEEEV